MRSALGVKVRRTLVRWCFLAVATGIVAAGCGGESEDVDRARAVCEAHAVELAGEEASVAAAVPRDAERSAERWSTEQADGKPWTDLPRDHFVAWCTYDRTGQLQTLPDDLPPGVRIEQYMVDGQGKSTPLPLLGRL